MPVVFSGIAPIYGFTGFDEEWESHPFSILDSNMNCTNESKHMFGL